MKNAITTFFKNFLKFLAYYSLILILIKVRNVIFWGHDITSVVNQLGYVAISIAVWCMINNIKIVNCEHNNTDK